MPNQAKDSPGTDTASDIQAQLAALRADLAALAATLAALSKSGAEAARQTAAEAYAEAKVHGGETVSNAAAQAEETLEAMSDYARKNPLQSLGMAAGLGMMLGLLFGRR